MVLAVNMPDNAIKRTFSPLIEKYDIPLFFQSWSLFAPRPTADNVHVLIRARTAAGKLTGWYDATTFFLDALRSNTFTPLRPVAEGLAHSSAAVYSGHDDIVDRTILVRTATAVLKLYVGEQIVSVQVELDAWPVASASSGNGDARAHAKTRLLDWVGAPDVAAIH